MIILWDKNSEFRILFVCTIHDFGVIMGEKGCKGSNINVFFIIFDTDCMILLSCSIFGPED